ncbi:MAG: hypothetical protein HY805_00355 [Nitrospirae bacterium]|nr:hypothetical protein [Nitrospirota bacterium]
MKVKHAFQSGLTDGSDTAVVRPSNWNADHAITFRGALVGKSGNVSLPASAWSTIAYDTEVYDTDNIHDNATNNSRLTVPSGVTKVRLTSVGAFTATGFTFACRLIKNGTTVICCSLTDAPVAPGGEGPPYSLVSPVIEVAAGDYFEFQLNMNNARDLAATSSVHGPTQFGMEIIN